jgi:hypothetical protein
MLVLQALLLWDNEPLQRNRISILLLQLSEVLSGWPKIGVAKWNNVVEF